MLGASGGTTQYRLLLPPAGKPPYPAVVWVYPDTVVADQPNRFDIMNNPDNHFNIHLLAARGFAVLEPSMPMPDEAAEPDPYLSLPAEVVPAVEHAVAAGHVDRDRLFVMGQSHGGYAAVGLLAQTRLFRGGIALAGLYNMISHYGVFSAPDRYQDTLPMMMGHPEMQASRLMMNGPPWSHMQQYLRNSPLFSVKDLTAPLLLMHGDADYVSITQSEEMFTACWREGKPCEFVRYWGEGHVFMSPANITDVWQRIFAWIERE
jgi:dipeptidyl aminopeptidase/acylaminoacyl peptidase